MLQVIKTTEQLKPNNTQANQKHYLRISKLMHVKCKQSEIHIEYEHWDRN